MNNYVAPELNKKAFTCPYCNVLASQAWKKFFYYYDESSKRYKETELCYATCVACQCKSLWFEGKMVHPSLSTAPLPHKDMPEIIKADYLEAKDIVQKSPRGACALLRLALDKLCDELEEECKGKGLDKKIKILVEKGLSSDLQQMFDFVRITGNDAVHELGEINAKDNPAIALALFPLINIIIEKMITEPKNINDLYALIPESKLEAIAKRDCQN